MRELTLDEVDGVSGGGFWDKLVDAAVGWAVGKALDAAASAVSSGTYGDGANGTDAMGNMY